MIGIGFVELEISGVLRGHLLHCIDIIPWTNSDRPYTYSYTDTK